MIAAVALGAGGVLQDYANNDALRVVRELRIGAVLPIRREQATRAARRDEVQPQLRESPRRQALNHHIAHTREPPREVDAPGGLEVPDDALLVCVEQQERRARLGVGLVAGERTDLESAVTLEGLYFGNDRTDNSMRAQPRSFDTAEAAAISARPAPVLRADSLTKRSSM